MNQKLPQTLDSLGCAGATYTTGELARLTGNTLRAVRHYEELRLITPRERLDGHHRAFDASQLERLTFITDMRELSFPISAIRDVLNARDNCESPCKAAAWATETLDEHIASLRTKLHTLRRVRDELVHTRETVEECRDCRHTWESRICPVCDVRTVSEPPRLAKLLW